MIRGLALCLWPARARWEGDGPRKSVMHPPIHRPPCAPHMAMLQGAVDCHMLLLPLLNRLEPCSRTPVGPWYLSHHSGLMGERVGEHMLGLQLGGVPRSCLAAAAADRWTGCDLAAHGRAVAHGHGPSTRVILATVPKNS